MKTVAIISVLVSIILSACDNSDVSGRPIIHAKYIVGREGFCKYFYNGLGMRGQSFEDSCDKYSVGDTIN